MDDDIKSLTLTISHLPPAKLADLFDEISQNILSMTHRISMQSAEHCGHLTACSKHLEQASREILQFAEVQQVDNNKENTMNNKKTNRLSRVQIAQDTLGIIKRGHYQHPQQGLVDVRVDIDHCIQQTKLFTPTQLGELTPELTAHDVMSIEVVNETTLQGAKRLHDQQIYQRIGVLNFASAKNAGGGFLGGSQAQEESLARSTALYASLQECPEYYHYHRRVDKSLLYSDHMIYTADCPVFKLDDGELLVEPYKVDFITSPAPNYGAVARQQADSLSQLEEVFKLRIRAMLMLAVEQGCDALVLGAWGCGVFANPAESVANCFAAQLIGEGEFVKSFRHITFSIPENPRTAENTLSFQRAFTT